MKTNKKGKKKKKKIEWAFKPTLGYEIKPELTKKEFETILARLSEATQEPSDPEKTETSD